jgi:Ca-activated chloride channel family protein
VHISTHLDVDLVAIDEADQVTCLLELTAPADVQAAVRPGRTLLLVLDRSGSMSGEPLEAAKQATAALARRLGPQDCFGVVVFDDEAEVVLPCRLMADHHPDDVARAIASIDSRGSTDISSGYLLALREAKASLAATGQTSATVLVVSDGEANAGITEPDRIHDLARTATGSQIVTSSLGFGLGYDEVLLEALSRGGNGTHGFAPDIDTCVGALQQTVSDLLDVSVMATTVRIRPTAGLVDRIAVRPDLPTWRDRDSLVLSVGDLFAGEQRRILIQVGVPSIPALGTCTVAEIEVQFTSVDDLADHRVVLPLTVNVVPGDQAAGRVPNPIVEVERLLVDVDDAKRQAAQSLREHDVDSAKQSLGTAMSQVAGKRREMSDAPRSLTGRLDEAAEELLGLADDLKHRSADYTAKSMQSTLHSTFRKRTAPTTDEEES